MRKDRDKKIQQDTKKSPAMDHRNPRKMARHHPGPFQSPLEKHLDVIRSMRRGRKTWEEIAAHVSGLQRAEGVQDYQVHRSTIFNFYKRYVDRLERQRSKGKPGAKPLGFEPVPGEPDYPGSSSE